MVAGQLTEAAVARFRRDWIALTGGEAQERALVALSGGADSTALLLLMQAARADVCAATVDHKLRPEASQEAADVAALCAARGIAHATLTGDLPDRAAGSRNLSARARALRYALLDAHAEQVGARWIVTAHHADDQCETMVMRLNRGSGIGGLVGVRAVDGKRVRPLLGWRRPELASIVAEAGMTPADDPSNRDDRYDRARLRKQLANATWLDAAAVAHSAALLGEAEHALAWMSERVARDVCEFGEDGAASLDPAGLPSELLRRLVLRCLRHIEPGLTPRGDDLARLIESLQRGPAIRTLGHVRVDSSGSRAAARTLWHFSAAPPHRSR